MSIENGGENQADFQAPRVETQAPVAAPKNAEPAVAAVAEAPAPEPVEPELPKVEVPDAPAVIEKATEQEKPMTAHERWKQRWEAKYSKIVPEIMPLVLVGVAVAIPMFEEIHNAISGEPTTEVAIKFWTEQLLLLGPSFLALIADRSIRRKARHEEQKALAADTVAQAPQETGSDGQNDLLEAA